MTRTGFKGDQIVSIQTEHKAGAKASAFAVSAACQGAVLVAGTSSAAA